jgi:hypothetical protein
MNHAKGWTIKNHIPKEHAHTKQEIYTFINNATEETITGKQKEIADSIGVLTSFIGRVIAGKRKSVQPWTLLNQDRGAN